MYGAIVDYRKMLGTVVPKVRSAHPKGIRGYIPVTANLKFAYFY
jgi:hypothetical protein